MFVTNAIISHHFTRKYASTRLQIYAFVEESTIVIVNCQRLEKVLSRIKTKCDNTL